MIEWPGLLFPIWLAFFFPPQKSDTEKKPVIVKEFKQKKKTKKDGKEHYPIQKTNENYH
jgi:hypothetical protein